MERLEAWRYGEGGEERVLLFQRCLEGRQMRSWGRFVWAVGGEHPGAKNYGSLIITGQSNHRSHWLSFAHKLHTWCPQKILATRYRLLILKVVTVITLCPITCLSISPKTLAWFQNRAIAGPSKSVESAASWVAAWSDGPICLVFRNTNHKLRGPRPCYLVLPSIIWDYTLHAHFFWLLFVLFSLVRINDTTSHT